MPFFSKNSLKLGTLGLLLAVGCLQPVQARTVVPDVYNDQRALLSKFFYEAVIQVAAQGGIDAASDLMEKVYLLNRDNLPVAFGYGQFLEARPDMSQALAFYEKLLGQFKKPIQQSVILYRMSILQDTMGDSAKAAQLLEKAITLFPEKPVPSIYYYDLGVYYSKLNRFPLTAHYSEKALEHSPESAPAWNNLGYSLARQGKLEEGLDAVQKALKLDPKNANAVDSLAYIYYRMGRYSDAITEYEKAVTIDPKLSESWLYLGHTYAATHTLDKAVQAYENFVMLTPQHEEKAAVEKKLLELKSEMLIEVAPPATSQASPE